MENKQKTIGVLTSGGDAPGMNGAIRAVVRCARDKGYTVMGIYQGYKGLIEENIKELKSYDVSQTIQRGGTFLYTARCKDMYTDEGVKRAYDSCLRNGIDVLVVIGGDGSFRGAEALSKLGQKIIGIPATIDLDVSCTEYTIGFDTAADNAVDAIDKVRDTSASHERCSIIEVMGRRSGYLALWCGIASGAEDILIPETYDNDIQKVIDHINEQKELGKKNFIIVNAEGVGHSDELAKKIEEGTGIETRATVLGYMQRGGNPSSRDRVYATAMGYMAAELIDQGIYNRIVVFQGGRFTHVDISEAAVDSKKDRKLMFDVADTITHNKYVRMRK